MIDLSPFFVDLAGAAALVVLISGWINTNLIKLVGWQAQVLSWAVAIGVAFLGSWKNIGIFAETDVLWTILNGIGAGLIANGVYDVKIVQTILEFVKAKQSKA